MPPHNLDAEESLLGAMLLRPDAISSAVEVLSAQGADAFYKPSHGLIYDAITNLSSEGQAVDPVTVAEELRRAGVLDTAGGLAYLVELTRSTPAISNAGHYARIVDENALLRRLITVAGDIAELGYSLPDDVAKAVDAAESLMFQVAERRVVDSTKGLHELLGATLDHLEALFERGDSITGLPTGFTDLDELLSGLQPSTLNIIGARPAMGKCVAFDTPIMDPTTGDVTTAAALYAAGTAGEPVDVAALTDDGHVVAARPSAFVDDGDQLVYPVHTGLGRFIRTTGAHPFLTPQGWKPLAELEVGAAIAVPARLPFFGNERLPVNEVGVVAHRLATAGLSGAEDREMEAAVLRGAEMGIDVIETLQRHNVWRVPPAELDIPSAILRLPTEQIEMFLERVMDSNRRARQGSTALFVARSARLARSVAHLFLRLGEVCECGAATLRIAGEVVDVVEVHRLNPRDERLRNAPTKDVMWDEIVEIGPAHEAQVYDLTVPELHNFVAADVYVHNTAFALGLASHAAVEHRSPVLFFSLEMGHRELTQRILASEARVDSQKMRTGKLNESDWTKISKALGRLEAPLYIDDNPNLTVMEIRAKARRLKSRLGSLGLIVVDYLQLMSGRGNAENRQVEVSEMSRGLKILARELEVPIVALSQLSRALELRADKRPMLADLRESGCLTADTRITCVDGRELAIGDIARDQLTDLTVWTLDERYRLVPGVMTRAFSSGVKEVFRLTMTSGRQVKASANHPFLTLDGWQHLDQLRPGSRIAVPRPEVQATWSRSRRFSTGQANATGATPTLMLSGRRDLSTSDVLWDQVASIDPIGPHEVFDATVAGTHNFVADGVVVHNSIEQDADVVMFLYRDEVYNPDSPDVGTAEIIVAKHRNGPTGNKKIAFISTYTKFTNLARGV